MKEREGNVLVSRVQVEDKDTRGTVAWRVKYKIHGDMNENFRIETDPETNEGLLYVRKVWRVIINVPIEPRRNSFLAALQY